MPESTGRERDLVLAPNEYAYVSDQTKGKIDIYVGPYKASLSQTDQAVIFSNRSKKFDNADYLEDAIKLFSTAPEGWYLTLKNPSTDGKQPATGTVGVLPNLDVGKKINVAGPVSYPLWPGQMVRVVQGHHLRSNQYIVARVYDEDAAKANWENAVIKGTEEDITLTMPNFTMGKQIIIKGTEVSFYIPPTGIEVIADENGNLIRDAETLERLEYSILKDEDGNKRYARGPEVVFPEPTETFVEKNGARKFKAIELNELSGLYIKVIADYNDDDSKVDPETGPDHDVGEELFITGKEQMIYFPREEHAIIKYGKQDIHYAIAIPAGEARYVLDRFTGVISIKEGPAVFLPDPRKEVIIRRMLDPKLVELWFPGNKEAISYNSDLQEMIAKYSETTDFISSTAYMNSTSNNISLMDHTSVPGKSRGVVSDEMAGDDFDRKTSYTPPRTVTLDTKYEGTIDVDIWTGYAILVVSKTGNRRVVIGPATVHLAYDESIEGFELSTGTPKNDDNVINDVYLRVLHNKVSDKVRAMTKDLCEVDINVSYRMNFEGNKDNWFNVENYVKFLTDHLRSVIRSAVKMYGIEAFYANSIEIVRDFVLGKHTEEGRLGKFFPENGMRVYDVEVLNVRIEDDEIEELLTNNQYEVVEQTLAMAKEDRRQERVEHEEATQREIDGFRLETKKGNLANKQEEFDLMQATTVKEKAFKAEVEGILNMENDEDLARLAKTEALRLKQEKIEKRLEQIERESETKAVVDKTNAVSTDMIAALQNFGDKALLEKASESFNILSIIGGKSITDVVENIFKGTKLDSLFKKKQK